MKIKREQAELSWAKLSTYWAELHYVKTIDGSVVNEVKTFLNWNYLPRLLNPLQRIYAILSLLVGLKKSLQRLPSIPVNV